MHRKNAPLDCCYTNSLRYGMRKERKHFLPKYFPVSEKKICSLCSVYIIPLFKQFVNILLDYLLRMLPLWFEPFVTGLTASVRGIGKNLNQQRFLIPRKTQALKKIKKESDQIAATPTIQSLSESFAKRDTRLARKRKAVLSTAGVSF